MEKSKGRIVEILSVGFYDEKRGEEEIALLEFTTSADHRWGAGEYAIFTLPELAALIAAERREVLEEVFALNCVHEGTLIAKELRALMDKPTED